MIAVVIIITITITIKEQHIPNPLLLQKYFWIHCTSGFRQGRERNERSKHNNILSYLSYFTDSA
jgi:hypothetical protein